MVNKHLEGQVEEKSSYSAIQELGYRGAFGTTEIMAEEEPEEEP